MKLDVTCMRYLTKDDYRVMVAVEMGMRNHELVPVSLIANIAKLRHGGIHKILSTCLRYKLLAHANQDYNGYRLSSQGYDILALHTLLSRKVIASVGNQIGVGKESDIFEALDDDGNEVVIKLHRLGRTSFRTVRKNRDYMKGKSKASWLFMSRLAALKEFAFMKALYAHGFPTPVPYDQNRHVVAMSKVPGSPMSQLRAGSLVNAGTIFDECLVILRRLAEHGLVHCDFNEFNLMVDENDLVTLIDFPQIVSTSHANAADLFRRDFNCLVKFFSMKMHYTVPDEKLGLELSDITISETRIDEDVKASGFSPEDSDEMSKYVLDQAEKKDGDDDDDDDDDYDDDGHDGNDINHSGESDNGENEAQGVCNKTVVRASSETVFVTVEEIAAKFGDSTEKILGSSSVEKRSSELLQKFDDDEGSGAEGGQYEEDERDEGGDKDAAVQLQQLIKERSKRCAIILFSFRAALLSRV